MADFESKLWWFCEDLSEILVKFSTLPFERILTWSIQYRTKNSVFCFIFADLAADGVVI